MGNKSLNGFTTTLFNGICIVNLLYYRKTLKKALILILPRRWQAKPGLELNRTVMVQNEAKTLRKVQWIYVVPVALAPLAHIFVTGAATFPKHKKVFFALVGAATAGAVANRMWLMADAGYPGMEGNKTLSRYESLRV